MLALTDQSHEDRVFTNQTFFKIVSEFGNPILAGTIIDLSEPEAWNLYAPPLNEVLPRLQALLTPTSYLPLVVWEN